MKVVRIFESCESCEKKIRPTKVVSIFWRSGLRWCAVPAAYIQRVFRRREAVIRKGCCGGKSFFIERLVMILLNGEELEVHVGDDIPKDAEALLAQLQRQHPGFQFGKV